MDEHVLGTAHLMLLVEATMAAKKLGPKDALADVWDGLKRLNEGYAFDRNGIAKTPGRNDFYRGHTPGSPPWSHDVLWPCVAGMLHSGQASSIDEAVRTFLEEMSEFEKRDGEVWSADHGQQTWTLRVRPGSVSLSMRPKR